MHFFYTSSLNWSDRSLSPSPRRWLTCSPFLSFWCDAALFLLSFAIFLSIYIRACYQWLGSMIDSLLILSLLFLLVLIRVFSCIKIAIKKKRKVSTPYHRSSVLVQSHLQSSQKSVWPSVARISVASSMFHSLSVDKKKTQWAKKNSIYPKANGKSEMFLFSASFVSFLSTTLSRYLKRESAKFWIEKNKQKRNVSSSNSRIVKCEQCEEHGQKALIMLPWRAVKC